MDQLLNSTVTAPQQSPSQPRLSHQDDADEDDDTVKQLQECSALYLSLQDCLVKTNRNWKSCQFDIPLFCRRIAELEVQALKGCNEKRKNSSKRS